MPPAAVVEDVPPGSAGTVPGSDGDAPGVVGTLPDATIEAGGIGFGAPALSPWSPPAQAVKASATVISAARRRIRPEIISESSLRRVAGASASARSQDRPKAAVAGYPVALTIPFGPPRGRSGLPCGRRTSG